MEAESVLSVHAAAAVNIAAAANIVPAVANTVHAAENPARVPEKAAADRIINNVNKQVIGADPQAVASARGSAFLHLFNFGNNNSDKLAF